jgi:hypothetical protein
VVLTSKKGRINLVRKSMKKIFFLLIISISTFAQSVEITPGSILPQVTTAQRTAIASPKNGMLVFDTNTQSYWFRQSGSWTELPKGGSTSNYWQLTGNTIKNTNSGGFWSENAIGLTSSSTNTTNPPTSPASGNGTRLMWIPSRSAFRAGMVDQNVKSWDADTIGLFSTAFGYNTKASGWNSTSMGGNTTASGIQSIAMGSNTTARGNFSTAMGTSTTASGFNTTTMGSYTTASGSFSTAMGVSTTASGWYSTAMGYNSTVSGYASIAMGFGTTASGHASTAMGSNTTASGSYSTAMGHKVIAEGAGSFIIGDYVASNAEPERVQSTDNRFTARFRGGYFFMTSGNVGTITGVHLAPNGNAWGSISDSTKKENFIKANGEEFLKKLSTLKLGSWNYKGVNTRNYGPMAQEVFTAFGKDELGTIGSDTMVNTLNMDGLLFIFAQALYEENEKLKISLQEAKKDIDQLATDSKFSSNENKMLEDRISKLETNNLEQLNTTLKKLELLEKQLKNLTEQINQKTAAIYLTSE